MLSVWRLEALSLAKGPAALQYVSAAGFAKARQQPEAGERQDSAVDQVLEVSPSVPAALQILSLAERPADRRAAPASCCNQMWRNSLPCRPRRNGNGTPGPRSTAGTRWQSIELGKRCALPPPNVNASQTVMSSPRGVPLACLHGPCYGSPCGALQALTTKLKLKLAALKALPEELRAHAILEDLTPPPLTRRIPTLTPPVPEYKNARQSTTTTPGRRIGTNR